MSEHDKPPSGLRRSGRAMWAAVCERLDLDRHEAQLLLEACRVADRLDLLDREIRKNGTMLSDGRPSLALAEARQQQLVLARLVASLRLPEDLTDPAKRPQRRGAARGAYQSNGRGTA